MAGSDAKRGPALQGVWDGFRVPISRRFPYRERREASPTGAYRGAPCATLRQERNNSFDDIQDDGKGKPSLSPGGPKPSRGAHFEKNRFEKSAHGERQPIQNKKLPLAQKLIYFNDDCDTLHNQQYNNTKSLLVVAVIPLNTA